MPWDQGPGVRCPGALVPGFASKYIRPLAFNLQHVVASHRGPGCLTHDLFGSHSPFTEKKSVSQIFFSKVGTGLQNR